MKNPFKSNKDSQKETTETIQATGSGRYKIDSRQKVRDVAGEHIVIQQSAGADDMTRVVALNESALLLYNRLKEETFVLENVVAILTEEYDVDATQAQTDAQAWIDDMRRQGLLTEC